MSQLESSFGHIPPKSQAYFADRLVGKVKTELQYVMVPHLEGILPRVCDQSCPLPKQCRMGCSVVCSQPTSPPPSGVNTAGTVWLRLDRGRPHLALTYLDSHPGSPNTPGKSTTKQKARAVNCSFSWSAIGKKGRCESLNNFLARN